MRRCKCCGFLAAAFGRSMSPRQAAAVVRPRIIDTRTDRNDAIRADRTGLAEHTALHAGDVADAGDARRLIELAQVIRQVWKLIEPAQIAFVADVVAGIEANETREQPPARLGLGVADEIALLRQPLLQPVQRVEQKL